MKELDIVKDLLQTVTSMQIYFNERAINIRNPEARHLFIQIRDDKMRNISKLQQKVERLQTKPSIIARMLPAKIRN